MAPAEPPAKAESEYESVPIGEPIVVADLEFAQNGDLLARAERNQTYRWSTGGGAWKSLGIELCGGLRSDREGRILFLDQRIDEFTAEGVRLPIVTEQYKERCLRDAAATSKGQWFTASALGVWTWRPGGTWVPERSITDLPEFRGEGGAGITDRDGNALVGAGNYLLRISPDSAATRIRCGAGDCRIGQTQFARLSLDSHGDVWFVASDRVYRLQPFAETATVDSPDANMQSVAIHPDGRVLAVGSTSEAGGIYQRDPVTGVWSQFAEDHGPRIAVAPDGRMFLFGLSDGVRELRRRK